MNALNINSCLSHIKFSLPVTIRQPSYLCDLIFVQPPRSIRSSSVVTISRPPTSSSLKITNRSFRYSAAYLWNQLSVSFISRSLPHSLTSWFIADHRFHQCHHFHLLSPLLSFTPSSKHTFSTKHFHHSLPIIDHPWTDSTVNRPVHWFYLAKHGRLSRHWLAFQGALRILFSFIHSLNKGT